MRIAMWSSYLIRSSPEDMVAIFSQRGWQYSELSDEHARMLLERGDPGRTGEQFRKFADEQGFSFPQGHLWIPADVAHPDDGERRLVLDGLKRWCELFAAVGAEAAVLHPGGQNATEAGWEPARIQARRLEGLAAVGDFVKGMPLTICLENLTPRLPVTLDELLVLTAELGEGQSGICLDTGHLNMIGGDCAEFVRKAGARLQALHVADNLGKNDDHLLPYGGKVEWEPVMRALLEIDYQGLFNLEVPGENHCPMDVLLAKLDYARELVTIMMDSAGRTMGQ